MTLGKGLIGTGIGTGGSVLLDARGAGGISQIAGGMIATDWLDADADLSAGTIGLLSFENRAGNLDATSVNQTITFNGRSVGLGTINSGTGSSTISAFYDIHDNNGFGVTNITAGSVASTAPTGAPRAALPSAPTRPRPATLLPASAVRRQTGVFRSATMPRRRRATSALSMARWRVTASGSLMVEVTLYSRPATASRWTTEATWPFLPEAT